MHKFSIKHQDNYCINVNVSQIFNLPINNDKAQLFLIRQEVCTVSHKRSNIFEEVITAIVL